MPKPEEQLPDSDKLPVDIPEEAYTLPNDCADDLINPEHEYLQLHIVMDSPVNPDIRVFFCEIFGGWHVIAFHNREEETRAAIVMKPNQVKKVYQEMQSDDRFRIRQFGDEITDSIESIFE